MNKYVIYLADCNDDNYRGFSNMLLNCTFADLSSLKFDISVMARKEGCSTSLFFRRIQSNHPSEKRQAISFWLLRQTGMLALVGVCLLCLSMNCINLAKKYFKF